MRSWKRAHSRIPCGHTHGCWILPASPYCVLSGPGWQKLRCPQHAGCEPPEDMDTAPRQEPVKVPEFSSVKHLAEAAERDVKMAQAGERDDE
jgi:hypothetical protein